jgi:hypothetical protein
VNVSRAPVYALMRNRVLLAIRSDILILAAVPQIGTATGQVLQGLDIGRVLVGTPVLLRAVTVTPRRVREEGDPDAAGLHPAAGRPDPGPDRHWQRMEKLLEDALIKISAVASKIDTISVRDMIEALIAGERNPRALADLARGRMKTKRAALIEALTGQFDDHHAEFARMLLDQIDARSLQIDRLTARIEELIARCPPPHHPQTVTTPATTSRRARSCRWWTASTRSSGSAPTPPRRSSARSDWT